MRVAAEAEGLRHYPHTVRGKDEYMKQELPLTPHTKAQPKWIGELRYNSSHTKNTGRTRGSVSVESHCGIDRDSLKIT